MIVLNALSLLGNVLVCISVYRKTRLRTTTNIYIVALAISDLLSAIFVMPLVSGVLVSGRWPFGEAVCQMHAFFSLFVVYVSPVTMGFTAVNRYVRICNSDQQYKRFFSPWKSRISLALAWLLIACYILITRLIGLQEFYFAPGYAVCMNKHISKIDKIAHYFLVVGLFLLLPLTVTVFSYRKVLKKIRAHNTGMVQALQGQGGIMRMVSTHEIRISKSLFVVVFAFMLCWIPTWLIIILTRFRVVSSMPRNIKLLCSFLVNLSNTINPFIYAGMNPLFRQEFRRLILFKAGERVEDTQGPNKFPFTRRSHTVSYNKQGSFLEISQCRQITVDGN